MKKAFKTYALIWVIILLVFNVICFVTPNNIAGVPKYSGNFWTAYVFIILAFIGQLYCANLAFKADNLKKLFYNIPLIRISYIGLIIMLIAGGIVMLIPAIPTWIGIIVCVIILAFTAVAVVKANAAADVVESIDNKIKLKTSFMRNSIADAETLFNNAGCDSIKEDCRKVYEAIRYSDPMSSEDLADIEEMIKIEMERFAELVKSQNEEEVTTSKNRLLELINSRNVKCKMMK